MVPMLRFWHLRGSVDDGKDMPFTICYLRRQQGKRHIIFIIETVIRGIQNFKSRVMALGRLNSQANNSMDTPASWSQWSRT